MVANECIVSTSINNIDNLYETLYTKDITVFAGDKINLFLVVREGAREKS